MAIHQHKPGDEVDSKITSRHLDDEATHAPAHDEVAAPAPGTKADHTALLPFMDLDFGFHPKPVAPLPFTGKAQLEVIAARQNAEKLLTGKDTEGDHAIKAVELMNNLPEAERAKVIDTLSPKAFDAMFDQIPEGDRARFAALVDASQDPKRKLRMWKDMHFAQVQSDAKDYSRDFAAEGEVPTDKQVAAKTAWDRREQRVATDKKEVDAELADLTAKDKAGKLTVADIDEMRGRKDRELAIEQKYNVNVASDPDAKWSKEELASMDRALGQLPGDHVHGQNMIPSMVRRHNIPGMTEGGDYEPHANDNDSQINMHEGAHGMPVPGIYNDPFEYAVTHEMGHRWASQHPDVFKKFEKTAGWKKLDRKGVEKAGLSEDEITELDARQRGATQGDGWETKDIEKDGKHFTTENLPKGQYESVDKTAFPTDPQGKNDRKDPWWYARSNSGEHFAEMYARSVENPNAMYGDFVANPQAKVAAANAGVARAEAALAHANGDNRAALAHDLDQAKHDASEAARAAKRQGDEFNLMRNDVFHTDKAEKDAEARMRARHASDDEIHAFQQQAARAVTPAQLDALEHKAK